MFQIRFFFYYGNEQGIVLTVEMYYFPTLCWFYQQWIAKASEKVCLFSMCTEEVFNKTVIRFQEAGCCSANRWINRSRCVAAWIYCDVKFNLNNSTAIFSAKRGANTGPYPFWYSRYARFGRTGIGCRITGLQHATIWTDGQHGKITQNITDIGTDIVPCPETCVCNGHGNWQLFTCCNWTGIVYVNQITWNLPMGLPVQGNNNKNQWTW